MHRSPLSALVLLAAVAACSTSDATAGSELLSQDSALVARLAPELAPELAPRRPALPDACGAVTTAAPPAAEGMAQAEALAHRAYAAEVMGDLPAARSLLARASDLDGTNESAVYHLGRITEALGDRAAAVTAYCRFLALTPTTAEADEARQRVARLSQPETHVAARSVREPSPTRRPARVATPRRAAPRPSAAARTVVASTAAATERVDTTVDAPAVPAAADHAAGGEVVATSGPEPTAAPSPAESRTSGGGPSRAQRAGIGAAAGAIIGAVTGRSVKGALIGAAAGGILGTATGGRLAPAGRGARP